MSKKKKQVIVVQVKDKQVKCNYCGHVGHKDEIVVTMGDKNVSNWHCLPRELSGSIDGIVPVCVPCACAHEEEFLKEFPKWFARHDRLPFLSTTIEMEHEYFRQWLMQSEKMGSFVQEYGIQPDEGRVCMNCKRHHGQVWEREHFPRLNLRMTLVNFVLGFHRPREVIMAHLLCNDCKPLSQGKDQIFFYDTTMKVLEQREERQAYLDRLPGPEKIEPAKVTLKAIPEIYRPKSSRPWEHKKTGT